MSKTSQAAGGAAPATPRFASIIMPATDCPGTFEPTVAIGTCSAGYKKVGNINMASGLNPIVAGPVSAGMSVNLSTGTITMTGPGTFLVLARINLYPEGNDRIFFRLQNDLSGTLFGGFQDSVHQQNTLQKANQFHGVFTIPDSAGYVLGCAISKENIPAAVCNVFGFGYSIIEIMT
jgi:hypothetical protein